MFRLQQELLFTKPSDRECDFKISTMKTKINHIFFFSLTFFGLTFFSSCKRNDSSGCPDTTPSYYYLSADDKNKIPFTGTDTLIYVSNTGDTAKLFGQEKKDYYNNVRSYGGNPDCSQGSSNYENTLLTFSRNNTVLNNLKYCLYIDVITSFSGLDISIDNTSFNGWIFAAINNESNYKDKVLINNQLYNVIKLKANNDSTSVIFYNHLYGILKIQLSNNQTWLKQ